MSYRVGIVAAPASPEAIGRLAARMPLWVIAAGDNRATVEALWRSRPTPDNGEGITSFSSSPMETREAWLGLLENVELHHGEYSRDPPVDELEVIGASASAHVRSALSEYGYLEVASTEDGFVARKPSSGH